MKKLMIAAFAVAFAAVAQAATVQWNSGTFADGFAGPDGVKIATSALYTMTVAFYSDAGATEVADVTGIAVSAAKPNGAYNNNTSDSFSSSTQYYVKAIISGTDLNGNEWAREAALASFTTPGQGSKTINFTTGDGFDEAGMKWGDWTKVGGGESVPEPTSALMLLVGLAGLALKRKVA